MGKEVSVWRLWDQRMLSIILHLESLSMPWLQAAKLTHLTVLAFGSALNAPELHILFLGSMCSWGMLVEKACETFVKRLVKRL